MKITESSFLRDNGVYAVVDGQFGSTGKGLAAAYIADQFDDIKVVNTTSNGPNSGHTSYFGDEKHVLTQLPTYMVQMSLRYPKISHEFHMNAGAVINPEKFKEELDRYPNLLAHIHPNAAVVTDVAVRTETGIKEAIGSTGKGTGAAIAQKIMRGPATVRSLEHMFRHNRIRFTSGAPSRDEKTLMEISQGFSLGINQQFYPFCTSRECTVGQGLSDASAHPYLLKGTMMVVRTFPIRVGGNSGLGYSDQEEITWAGLGQAPERTTVTNKIRRVFTWSDTQFKDAVRANRPDIIFLNFCNYLPEDKVRLFIWDHICKPYKEVMEGRDPEMVLMGFGPKVEDVEVWDGVPF